MTKNAAFYLDINQPSDREFFNALAVLAENSPNDAATGLTTGVAISPHSPRFLLGARSYQLGSAPLNGESGCADVLTSGEPLGCFPYRLPDILDSLTLPSLSHSTLFQDAHIELKRLELSPTESSMSASANMPLAPILLLHLDFPAWHAHACLAVVAPQIMNNFAGQQASIPAGCVSYHGASQVEPTILANQALNNAYQLALAACAVGLAPAGSALVLTGEPSAQPQILTAIFSLFKTLGFGPFIAWQGLETRSFAALLATTAPLCQLTSPAFGLNTSLEAITEKIERLYGQTLAQLAPTGSVHPNFSRFIALALALDSGLRFACAGEIAPIEPRLRLLGDLIACTQRWSEKYACLNTILFESLLQARLLQRGTRAAQTHWQRTLLPALHALPHNSAALPSGLLALGLSGNGLRLEHDSLGAVSVPAHVHYGAQTERSRKNFALEKAPIGQNYRFVRAMGLVKQCAALANMDIGLLDTKKGTAIANAAQEVIEGLWDQAFPVDRLQGGGGVGMNMNINELLANRANELLGYALDKTQTGAVHPNDDVNRCHSTNDLVHTAMHLACWDWLQAIDAQLLHLESALQKIISEHQNTVKLGRTCLMDALPMTIAQQFSGYLSFVARRRRAFAQLAEHCLELGMGASGIGTSLGISPGFLPAFFDQLSAKKGLPCKPAENYFDVLQHGDFYVELSAALKAYATGMSSLARDLRLMGSGPRAGFGEITLPAVQPGSSIMPGKINPLIPELINQIAYLVCGNDTAISMAAEGGDIDLNVWEAVFLQCITQSFELLCHGTQTFVDSCLTGLVVNTQKCLSHAESSLALATVIAEVYGYQKGVEIAALAAQKNLTIKAAAVQAGLLNSADAEILLAPRLLSQADEYAKVINIYRLRCTQNLNP